MRSILTLVAFLTAWQRSDVPLPVQQDAKYWAWLSAEWKPDDSGTVQQRKSIDKAAQLGTAGLPEIEKQAKRFRTQFEKAAKVDAKPLTLWAYAAWRARLTDPFSSERTGFNKAYDYIQRVKPMPTYEYSRTRFLVAYDLATFKHIPLAERLLAKDPKDYPVKYTLVRILKGKDSAKAKKLCGELIADNPDRFQCLGLMGDVYFAEHLMTNRREPLAGAKKYYELFLKKAPPTDSYIEVVKSRLTFIAKRL